MNKYNFYMQKCSKDGTLVDGTLKDLENDFQGLKYSKLEGITSYGVAKNIYTEKYSDSNTLRTYVPNKITREAISVTLKLYFIGEQSVRQKSFDDFIDFVSNNGYNMYWDNARNKKVILMPPTEEIKPSEEKWCGSTPYIEVSIKFQAITGNAENVVSHEG